MRRTGTETVPCAFGGRDRVSRYDTNRWATPVRRERLAILALIVSAGAVSAQPAAPTSPVILLKPDRVFDGDTMHPGWAVRIVGNRIDGVGPVAGIGARAAEGGLHKRRTRRSICRGRRCCLG